MLFLCQRETQHNQRSYQQKGCWYDGKQIGNSRNSSRFVSILFVPLCSISFSSRFFGFSFAALSQFPQ